MQDKNYHLIQLFKKMKYFNLCFKEFKYNEKLTRDENISKISNFFAKQKPIYFFDYINERSLKNISEEQNIKEDSKDKKSKSKKNDDKAKNFKFPKTYLIEENTSYSNKEFYKYIELINIFKFTEFEDHNRSKSNKKIGYSLKFKDKDLKKKIDIFYHKNYYYYNYYYEKRIDCKPIIKISDLKWIFRLDDQYHRNYWICITNLVDEIDNIFEAEFIIDCGKLNKTLELEKQKYYLIYKGLRNKYNYFVNNIIIFDPNFPENYIVKKFKNRYIETIFKLNNFKNILLIFLAEPLLNLLIYDYKLNQVDTIIDLINPIIPFRILYCWRPYIYEIKELDNNKLIFYGSQRMYHTYKSYYFKIIFNYKNLDIEMAENIEYYDVEAWGI